MAGKFGADFNENQPSDSDMVKKGAQWLRDIKSRAKAFCTVLFNLETGDFKDNVVRSTALKDLNPTPAGTHTRVTVNAKGQVTSGDSPTVAVSAKMNRYSYYFGSGFDPDGATITGTGGTDDNAKNINSYSFTVPAGVERIFVRVQGSGGGSGATFGGGGGGAYIESAINVSEGDVFLVWVGEGAADAGSGRGGMSKFEFAPLKYLKANSGSTSTDATSTLGDGGTPDIAFYTALSAFGGRGTATTGGAAGCGFPVSIGTPSLGAGSPPASASVAGNGFVTVDYWL